MCNRYSDLPCRLAFKILSSRVAINLTLWTYAEVWPDQPCVSCHSSDRFSSILTLLNVHQSTDHYLKNQSVIEYMFQLCPVHYLHFIHAFNWMSQVCRSAFISESRKKNAPPGWRAWLHINYYNNIRQVNVVCHFLLSISNIFKMIH